MIAIKGLDMPKPKEYLRIEIDSDGNIWQDQGDEWVLLKKSAIDIVQCKDCKHFNEETDGCIRNPSVKAWWEKDFCSYGERRT